MNAQFLIDRLPAKARAIEFDQVEVESQEREEITFRFSNAAGHCVRVVLPRAKLKELVTWRMILSL